MRMSRPLPAGDPIPDVFARPMPRAKPQRPLGKFLIRVHRISNLRHTIRWDAVSHPRSTPTTDLGTPAMNHPCKINRAMHPCHQCHEAKMPGSRPCMEWPGLPLRPHRIKHAMLQLRYSREPRTHYLRQPAGDAFRVGAVRNRANEPGIGSGTSQNRANEPRIGACVEEAIHRGDRETGIEFLDMGPMWTARGERIATRHAARTHQSRFDRPASVPNGTGLAGPVHEGGN